MFHMELFISRINMFSILMPVHQLAQSGELNQHQINKARSKTRQLLNESSTMCRKKFPQVAFILQVQTVFTYTISVCNNGTILLYLY